MNEIVRILEHPISVRQAFWAPYTRTMRWIEEQIAKRAGAADSAIHAGVTAHGEQVVGHVHPGTPPAKPATPAAPGVALLKPKFDVGVVAALGVAVGGITAALGALLSSFFGLGIWMPFGLLGLMLLISLPSMIIAALIALAATTSVLALSPTASFTLTQKWQRCPAWYCETGWYASPAVADVDQDGQVEALWGGYTLMSVNGRTGAIEWNQPRGSSSRLWPGIVVADLDGQDEDWPHDLLAGRRPRRSDRARGRGLAVDRNRLSGPWRPPGRLRICLDGALGHYPCPAISVGSTSGVRGGETVNTMNLE